MMILVPVAIAAVLLVLGGGLAVFLMKRVYLPRLGLSMAALHETGEQLETAFDGAKVIAAIYGGAVILALLAAVGFTNLYLTKHLFRHIQRPLNELVEGVERIQNGNLDAPIGYVVPDEFRPACDAVDEMAARLKGSLEAQSRQQQQKQELIAGMSHDLKSPLTSIRAYTEGLLDGVAKDEAAQRRYLEIIYAKETELESLVNRLFSFAKFDLEKAPAQIETLEISGALSAIVEGFDAEGLAVQRSELPDSAMLAPPEREDFSRRSGDSLRWTGVLHLYFPALPARRRNVGFSCCAAHTPRSLLGKPHTAATRGSRRRTAAAAEGCKDAKRSRRYPLTLLLRQTPEPLVAAALRKNTEISFCDFQRPL